MGCSNNTPTKILKKPSESLQILQLSYDDFLLGTIHQSRDPNAIKIPKLKEGLAYLSCQDPTLPSRGFVNFVDGYMTGLGIIEYSELVKYRGGFYGGLYDGHGEFTKENGEGEKHIYIGDFKNGVRHGFGKESKIRNGIEYYSYTGEFRFDTKTGIGKEEKRIEGKTITFEGNFLNNIRNGEGHCVIDDNAHTKTEQIGIFSSDMWKNIPPFFYETVSRNNGPKENKWIFYKGDKIESITKEFANELKSYNDRADKIRVSIEINTENLVRMSRILPLPRNIEFRNLHFNKWIRMGVEYSKVEGALHSHIFAKITPCRSLRELCYASFENYIMNAFPHELHLCPLWRAQPEMPQMASWPSGCSEIENPAFEEENPRLVDSPSSTPHHARSPSRMNETPIFSTTKLYSMYSEMIPTKSFLNKIVTYKNIDSESLAYIFWKTVEYLKLLESYHIYHGKIRPRHISICEAPKEMKNNKIWIRLTDYNNCSFFVKGENKRRTRHTEVKYVLDRADIKAETSLNDYYNFPNYEFYRGDIKEIQDFLMSELFAVDYKNRNFPYFPFYVRNEVRTSHWKDRRYHVAKLDIFALAMSYTYSFIALLESAENIAKADQFLTAAYTATTFEEYVNNITSLYDLLNSPHISDNTIAALKTIKTILISKEEDSLASFSAIFCPSYEMKDCNRIENILLPFTTMNNEIIGEQRKVVELQSFRNRTIIAKPKKVPVEIPIKAPVVDNNKKSNNVMLSPELSLTGLMEKEKKQDSNKSSNKKDGIFNMEGSYQSSLKSELKKEAKKEVSKQEEKREIRMEIKDTTIIKEVKKEEKKWETKKEEDKKSVPKTGVVYWNPKAK